MASALTSRGGKLYKSLYEKLGKAGHEKQPEKGENYLFASDLPVV